MVTDTMEDRACELGNYIVENRATVRAVAKKFGLSKSSVHKDVTARLYWVDRALYDSASSYPRNAEPRRQHSCYHLR